MTPTLVQWSRDYDIDNDKHDNVGEDDDDVDHVDHLEQKTVEEEERGEGRHRQPASCIINYVWVFLDMRVILRDFDIWK